MRSQSLAVTFLVLLMAGCGDTAPKAPNVAELKAMLAQNDPNQQMEAAMWIKQLGPTAAETRPALIAALKSPHAAVRQEVASALGHLGPDAADAVPALMAALEDTEPSVRNSAADALGRLGPAAAAAIPALENLSKQANLDKQAPSCSSAENALKKIRE